MRGLSGWIRKIIAMITLRGDYRNYRFWRLGNQKLAGSQERNKKIKTLKIPLIEAGIFRGRFAITENAADVPSSATYLLATDRGLGNPMVSDSTVENNASINGEKYQK